ELRAQRHTGASGISSNLADTRDRIDLLARDLEGLCFLVLRTGDPIHGFHELNRRQGVQKAHGSLGPALVSPLFEIGYALFGLLDFLRRLGRYSKSGQPPVLGGLKRRLERLLLLRQRGLKLLLRRR